MADDPYQVLGVSRAASDEDVRKAYLKLVKELHPDINPSRAAEDRFKKVTSAFDLLGDSDKRRKFDRGELNAAGETLNRGYRAHAGAGPGFGQGGGQGGSPGGGAGWNGGFSGFDSDNPFSDIFSGLRGGRPGSGPAPRRGQDVRYTLDVDFLEAANGAKKRVTLPGGATLDLAVPAGANDGQVLRLKGKGHAGQPGADAGDALIELKVRADPLFKRSGNDILCEVPVTLDEAILGAAIEVATLTGRVQLTLPKGTSSGRVLRLKGKGIANPSSGPPGDLLVTIRIVLPDVIDDDLAAFIQSWRQTRAYDPGRK